MKQIILKSLRKNPWANVVKYRNCHDDLAPYFTTSGGIYTGLGDKEFKELTDKPEFKGIDLSQNSSYWQRFRVRVGEEPLLLNVEDANDLLKYYFLKSHKDVQDGMNKRKAGAKYVLLDEEVEAKEINKVNANKRKAILEYEDLSMTDKRNCMRLYNINADDMKDAVIDNKLYEMVEKDPKKFLDLWVNNNQKDTEIFISKAMSKGIITKNGTIYFIGDTKSGKQIGHSLQDAISYLMDIKNQEDKIAINKQLGYKEKTV